MKTDKYVRPIVSGKHITCGKWSIQRSRLDVVARYMAECRSQSDCDAVQAAIQAAIDEERGEGQ
jgi:hypothetical protein